MGRAGRDGYRASDAGRGRAQKFVVLAPQSQDRTWDVIIGAYGPDVEALDRALKLMSPLRR
jgi:hypothetical protein